MRLTPCSDGRIVCFDCDPNDFHKIVAFANAQKLTMKIQPQKIAEFYQSKLSIILTPRSTLLTDQSFSL